MQARPDDIDRVLQDGLPPVVWIHGEEPLIEIETADAVRRRARELGFAERVVLQVERGFSPDMIGAETGALSLFAERKLVEVRCPGRPSKELARAIAEQASTLAGTDEVRLLVGSGRLDKATTGAAWFAPVARGGLVVPVYPVERSALPQWIANRLARQRQRADADTLRMIAERVEGNLLAAHQEIRKLGLLFEPGALPAEEAQEAVLSVARYGSFDLLEAALSGDVERTLRSLDGLRAEGEPAPLLLWALADGTRTLEAATEARLGGRPVAEVLRSARVFGRAREQAFQAAASRFTPSQVRKILQSAARTDRIVKGIEAGDEWDALLRLALALAGAPLPAEPAAR
ncbi:MAG: DNA polymerase III subunit delta [Burkholderiaceae bacterium]|nr:DNA polymerase III subunit delta [Burkholderiaceae bacterium]